jgi:hypothetical protein
MHLRVSSLPLAALLVLPLACVDAPKRADDQSDQSDQADQSAQAKAKSEQLAATPAPAESKPKPGSLELSAEELELLDADPKTLSPEQNRKRAYALRKKIMQNPDSPQAQALEEARAAAVGGELTPEQVDPDAKPKDEGLVIELPEHLKDQRVSKGEPAE